MMASIFNRAKENFLAEAHQFFDENEKKSPIAMLNQYLRNCEKETQKIEGLISRQAMLKRQFLREKEQAQFLVNKRSNQAEIAAKANEVELEARARQEIEYYTKQASKLDELHLKAENDVYQLQNQLHDMKNKLKEMHTKRLELMSRENVAHANRRINDSLNKFSDQNPFLRFDELEHQISELELRINEDYERDTFDMRIAKLERELNEDKKKKA